MHSTMENTAAKLIRTTTEDSSPIGVRAANTRLTENALDANARMRSQQDPLAVVATVHQAVKSAPMGTEQVGATATANGTPAETHVDEGEMFQLLAPTRNPMKTAITGKVKDFVPKPTLRT